MDRSTSIIKLHLDRLRSYDREVAAMPKGRARSSLQLQIGLQLEQLYQFQVENAKGRTKRSAASLAVPSVGCTEAPNH